jgi:hypothetical protein
MNKVLIKTFIALGLLFSVDSALAAEFRFSPIGRQFDRDKIRDIRLDPSTSITFEIFLDTTGLNEPLDSLGYIINFDPTELKLKDGIFSLIPFGKSCVNTPVTRQEDEGICFGGFGPTQFQADRIIKPDSTRIGIGHEDIELGKMGIIDRLTFDVQPGLVNDGFSDFDLSLTLAKTFNGNSKIDQFAQLDEPEVEVQPFPDCPNPFQGKNSSNFQNCPPKTPEPALSLSLLALGTLGVASILKRKQNQKSTEKETTKVG